MTIFVDVSKFNQVIRNLVSNAFKFSPSECEVNVYAFLVQNGCRVDATTVNVNDPVTLQIEIHDQGPGIPEVCLNYWNMANFVRSLFTTCRKIRDIFSVQPSILMTMIFWVVEVLVWVCGVSSC